MEENKERVFTFPDNLKMFENPIVNMEREEFQEWLGNATMEEKIKFLDDFIDSQRIDRHAWDK